MSAEPTLEEVDRRALRAAVRELLKACDEADGFMGGSQPYIHTTTVRRIVGPWLPSGVDE